MAAVLRFLADFSPLVYSLLGLGLILSGVRLWRAWRLHSEAIFGLEREIAQKRVNQFIALLFIIVLLIFGELAFEAFLAPTLPASLLLATATLNPGLIPTNTLSPEMATRISGTPVATTIPGAIGCVPGQIMITSPKPGQEIQGKVPVTGTADIPNFGFFKYEVAVQGTEMWTTILAGRIPVKNDNLGSWDTTQLTPGDYLLRLVVTDNQGQALPVCIIPVRVLAQ